MDFSIMKYYTRTGCLIAAYAWQRKTRTGPYVSPINSLAACTTDMNKRGHKQTWTHRFPDQCLGVAKANKMNENHAASLWRPFQELLMTSCFCFAIKQGPEFPVAPKTFPVSVRGAACNHICVAQP